MLRYFRFGVPKSKIPQHRSVEFGKRVLRDLMRYVSTMQCEAQLESISPNSSEEPLRQFYAAVFPAQKIAATFSYSGFPEFLQLVVKSSLFFSGLVRISED